MNKTELSVRLFVDQTYEVVEFYLDGDGFRDDEQVLYQGSISDCLAYIQLNRSGLLV